MGKPPVEPVPDAVRGPLEHRRPRGERPAVTTHRRQHRPAVRRDQPQPLSRPQRAPRHPPPVDPPAPRISITDFQRFPPTLRRAPGRPHGRQRPVQGQVLVHPRERFIRDPRRTELPALGDPRRHRERDRQRQRRGRQRRDLRGEQVAELLAPQPRRERQPAHRSVTRQLAATVPAILTAIWHQARQRPQEHLREASFQVLDGDVRLRPPPDRLVHPPLPDLIPETGQGLLISERLSARMPLACRPPVEPGQDADVLVPRRSLEPRTHRTRCPMDRVRTQPRLQRLPAVKHSHPATRQVLHPVPHDPGVNRPAAR